MGNPYSEIPHFSFILFLNKFNISLMQLSVNLVYRVFTQF